MLRYRTVRVNLPVINAADLDIIWVLRVKIFPVCEALKCARPIRSARNLLIKYIPTYGEFLLSHASGIMSTMSLKAARAKSARCVNANTIKARLNPYGLHIVV